MPITQRSLARGAEQKKADIIFVIDSSGSMSDCYTNLLRFIEDFVEGLLANPQINVDFRLGAVAAGSCRYRLMPFVNSPDEFRSSFGRLGPDGCDELTLPAIDLAMDYDWRPDAQRIVIVFTDEPVDGGADPDFERNHLTELMDKARTLHVRFFIYAPDCPDYSRIAEVPKSAYTPIYDHDAFFGVSFRNELVQCGKTISNTIAAAGQEIGTTTGVPRDIYGIEALGSPEIERLS